MVGIPWVTGEDILVRRLAVGRILILRREVRARDAVAFRGN
jgi:hypothetical protein